MTHRGFLIGAWLFVIACRAEVQLGYGANSAGGSDLAPPAPDGTMMGPTFEEVDTASLDAPSGEAGAQAAEPEESVPFAAACEAPPAPGTSADGVTFVFTGAPQAWQVPLDVHSVSIEARGAQGGGRARSEVDPGVQGGRGALVRSVLDVEPGEILCVFVGGAGGDYLPPNTGGLGGWNGGGVGGADNVDGNGPAGGGGGASDVRRGGCTLEDRVVVAAGGGGAECCSDGAGGEGGGSFGASGTCVGIECSCAFGGGGGSVHAGGTAGLGCDGDGEPGTLGLGGAGGPGNRAGGGGGGGYFGGGGGGGCCLGAGGGAGSSFALGVGASFEAAAHAGHGEITITPR